MAASFTWNSVDFGEANHKCFVVGAVHPMLGEPRVNLMPLSNANGAVSQGASLGELYFRFSCVIDADSEAERETCFWNVISDLTATVNGEATLVFDHMPTRSWEARLCSGVDGELAINGAEFTLEFVAPNPTATVIP